MNNTYWTLNGKHLSVWQANLRVRIVYDTCSRRESLCGIESMTSLKAESYSPVL